MIPSLFVWNMGGILLKYLDKKRKMHRTAFRNDKFS